MQAIEVKYLGPTNTKGSRYKATTAGGRSATVPYDHALSPEHNAAHAVVELCLKLGWLGTYAFGSLVNSYVAVNIDSPQSLRAAKGIDRRARVLVLNMSWPIGHPSRILAARRVERKG